MIAIGKFLQLFALLCTAVYCFGAIPINDKKEQHRTLSTSRRLKDYPRPHGATRLISPLFHDAVPLSTSAVSSVEHLRELRAGVARAPEIRALQQDTTIYTTGYTYFKYFLDDYCGSTSVASFGYALGICIVGYDTNNQPSGSAYMYYNSSTGTAYSLTYNDTACSGKLLFQLPMIENQCYPLHATEDTTFEFGLSFQAMISLDTEMPIPSNDNLVITGHVVGGDSCNGATSMFITYQLNHCFAHGNHSSFALSCPNGESSTEVNELLFKDSQVCNYAQTSSTFNTGCILAYSDEYRAVNQVLEINQFSSSVIGDDNIDTTSATNIEENSEPSTTTTTTTSIKNPKTRPLHSFTALKEFTSRHKIHSNEDFTSDSESQQRLQSVSTNAPGYLNIASFVGGECQGDAYNYGGFAVGVCMIEYNGMSEIEGSLLIVSDSITAQFRYYNASDCRGFYFADSLSLDHQCTYEYGFSYSISVVANISTPPVPENYGGTYYYDATSSLCQSTPVQYDMYLSGQCIEYELYSTSYECYSPSKLMVSNYNNSMCQNDQMKQQTFLGQCLDSIQYAYDDDIFNGGYTFSSYFRMICTLPVPNNNDDFRSQDDDTNIVLYEYVNIYCEQEPPMPTRAPLPPIALPTPAPSVGNRIVTNVTQILSNVSFASFMEPDYFVSNQMVLFNAILDSFYYNGIYSINTQQLHLWDVEDLYTAMEVTNPSTLVKYTIISNDMDVNFVDIKGALTNSIVNGSFTESLRMYSLYFSTPALLYSIATSDGLLIVDVNGIPDDDTPTPSNSSSGSSSSLSSGAIAGIVIAILVVVAGVACYVYFFHFHNNSASKNNETDGSDNYRAFENPVVNTMHGTKTQQSSSSASSFQQQQRGNPSFLEKL